MRKAKKFLKRFFKSVLSFSILGSLALDLNAQTGKGLENTKGNTSTKQSITNLHAGKKSNNKPLVVHSGSVYDWAFNSGKINAQALKDLDRNWLNMLNQYNSTAYRALAATTYWPFEKTNSDVMTTMREIQQRVIRALNMTFNQSSVNTQQKRASTKKAAGSKKVATGKTT